MPEPEQLSPDSWDLSEIDLAETTHVQAAEVEGDDSGVEKGTDTTSTSDAGDGKAKLKKPAHDCHKGVKGGDTGCTFLTNA